MSTATAQLELDIPSAPAPDTAGQTPPRIAGLRYIEDFLSSDEQDSALDAIDAAPWRDDLRRRVQHYGWRYDYRSRIVTLDMRLGPFPPWLLALADKLREAGFFDDLPDQAIVNEYLPGQGIAMHMDRRCFGPVVATISLADAWRMDFRPSRQPEASTEHLLLRAGSVLTLSDDARYRWLHGIAPRRRERDAPDGWRPRRRRVSVTFRTVLLDDATHSPHRTASTPPTDTPDHAVPRS